MEDFDGARYTIHYDSNGTHTKIIFFKCKTHLNCTSVMRRTQEQARAFVLEMAGEHSLQVEVDGAELPVPHDIHRAIKGEVDNLLAGLGPEAVLT